MARSMDPGASRRLKASRWGLAPLLLALGLLPSCDEPIQMMVASAAIDRQCDPKTGCPDNLMCVRLYFKRTLSDGGLMLADNYTCHPACMMDSECQSGYRCYMTMPPPMPKVCVRSEIIDLLVSDGGV